jgi:O-antigen ligase
MLVAFIPWVTFHFRVRYALPFVLLWTLSALHKPRQLQIPRNAVVSLVWTTLFLGMYLGIGVLFLPFGHGDGMSYEELSEALPILFPLMVFHISIRNGRLRELRLLTLFGFFCLATAAGMTILGETAVEGGSRALTAAGGGHVDPSLVDAALDAGIGGFGPVYGIGLLVFPVLYCITFMPWLLKVFFACIMLLSLAMVYSAGYSILIIGIVLAGAVYLVARSGAKLLTLKILGVVLVMSLVTAVANPRIMKFSLTPLQRLGNLIGKQEYQYRLDSIIDAVSGKRGTYATFRTDLYWRSWEVFLRHPFFGIGSYDYRSTAIKDNIGGHSLLLDILGRSGVFGLSIFICFLVCHSRYLRVMSPLLLGCAWWPSYYIFMFSAGAVALINPLSGIQVFSDLLLFIPTLPLFFERNYARAGVQCVRERASVQKHADYVGV